MKLRHKTTHIGIEGLAHGVIPDDHILIALPRYEWDIVPDVIWKDVTSQCEMRLYRHKNEGHAELHIVHLDRVISDENGYRLSWIYRDKNSGAQAIIVEKAMQP